MKYLIAIFTLLSFQFSYAQSINWSSLNHDQKSITYLNFGYDFGITSQIGNAHKLNIDRPILLTADFSFPMGKSLIDDFKFRIGGQMAILKKNNFIFSAKLYGSLRRHETNLVRMVSFGSELAGLVGYYKSSWHLAGEFGFDKSIITHLEHDEEMRKNFPGIVDGWFLPSGGHFYFGLQGSKTLGDRFELSMRVGATKAQFRDEDAILPYYAQLGLIFNFKNKKQ